MGAPGRIPIVTARQWSAAKIDRLTGDWPTYTRPIDVDLRTGMQVIRARARDLAQNSDHAKGFLRMVRNNIVGPSGFVLQARARLGNGKPDLRAREILEAEWAQWGRRGNCEVSGKFSWTGLQRHLVETVARDGEAFVRIVRPWPNRWGMALQVIDPEAVDILYNGEHEGRRVVMGVELDAWRHPVAYHLYGEPPPNTASYRGTERVRVPAAEMLHIYRPEFAWQTRGVSWLAVAAVRVHQMTGTEDAEITAARASACKIAAYEAEEWAPPNRPNAAGLLDANGNPLSPYEGEFSQDLAPGVNEVVPYGYKLRLLDPQHPNTAMPDFLKWALRSAATGWGVSYNALGNDAEGVNYTSLRYFLGIERDNWMEEQDWFCGELPEPIRALWTADQVALGNLPTRPNRPAQWSAINWQPRRWEGPDPAKQTTADRGDLEIGATTLTAILARRGQEFDDTVQERVQELSRIRELAQASGLTLEQVLPYLTAALTAHPGTAAADPNAQETPPDGAI